MSVCAHRHCSAISHLFSILLRCAMGNLLSRVHQFQPTHVESHPTHCRTNNERDESASSCIRHGPALRIPESPTPTNRALPTLPHSTLRSWCKADTKVHATTYRALAHIRKASFRLVDLRLEWIVDTLVPSVLTLAASDSNRCSVPLPAQFAQVIHATIHSTDDSASLEISLGDDHQRIRVAPFTADQPEASDNEDDPAAGRFALQIEISAVEDDQRHVTHIEIEATSDGRYHVRVGSQLLLTDGRSLCYSPLYGMPDAEKAGASSHQQSSTAAATPSSLALHECIICLTEPKTAALVPCQHLCVCKPCALILKMQRDPNNRRCPVCRTLIHSILILDHERVQELVDGEETQE